MAYAIKIPIEGEAAFIECNNLKDMQEAVGGYVETVPFSGFENADSIMLADSDGLLKGLKINTTASVIAGRVIVGDTIMLRILPDAISGWETVVDAGKAMKIVKSASVISEAFKELWEEKP